MIDDRKSGVEKLIIIGSGPAGLTAAIYAARGGNDPLVIAGRQAGGQLTTTTDVDDFPGFPEGIQGPELMTRMRKQAERFNTRFLEEDAVSVNFKKNPFVIRTENYELRTKALIIATGASARWLGLPSEQRLRGRGVSACAVCDGFFFKGKTVAVVGGGDTAMREAYYLSKLCKKVTVIHRRSELRAQLALQDLVKSQKNIDFIWDSEVEKVLGEDKLTGLRLKSTRTVNIGEIKIDGLFVAIGHKPNTDFLKGQIELDNSGYIVLKRKCDTSVPGVFAAGDVADHRYRQAVTASGAGCMAAFDAEEYLSMLKMPAEY